jgi:hypothetical protein
MPDLKAIYRAETAEAGAAELDNFEAQWGKRYPAIGQAWRRAWEYVVPLFAFPSAIRKMIYTRMRSTSPHMLGLVFLSGTGDRVAKSGARGCKLRRAVAIVAPPLRRPCAVPVVGGFAIG